MKEYSIHGTQYREDENGKVYRQRAKTTLVERDGKKYAETEYVWEEEKPFWGDGYRNTHKANPTEKAPSFRRR